MTKPMTDAERWLLRMRDTAGSSITAEISRSWARALENAPTPDEVFAETEAAGAEVLASFHRLTSVEAAELEARAKVGEEVAAELELPAYARVARRILRGQQ